MRYRRTLFAVLAVLLAGPLLPTPGDAQVDRLRRRAQRQITQGLQKRIEGAVKCAVTDQACVDQAKRDGEDVVLVDDDGNVITDPNGNPVTDPAQAEAVGQEPGEGVWRNYDFVPGRDVWFASDFSDERVGRFPASQLEYVRGNMQIVERSGERILEVTDQSTFRVQLPEVLPESFSLEFYVQTTRPNAIVRTLFSPREGSWNRYPNHYLQLYHTSGIAQGGNRISSNRTQRIVDGLQPIRFQLDDQYAILYMGSDRIAQIPNAVVERTNAIEFEVGGTERFPTYLKEIVVGVGLDELYGALIDSGAWTTRGILFDIDSDVLRPESTPVLDELLTTLESHEDLSITIEGHTDSTGDDDHNQDLSERRAQSVVRHLIAQGVAEERLAAVGKGEMEPVADNETPAGRQQNRRVVIRVADPQ